MNSNIDAYKKYVAPSAPSRYFKLDDGKTAKIRVCSEAFVYTDEYKGKVSTRYAWVIWNFTEEMAQVWQASVTSFKAVQALAVNEEWGDPTQYNINITREGTGKETTYAITPSPNRNPLTVEQSDAAANLDLFEVVENAIPLSQLVDEGTELPVPAKRTERDNIPTDDQVTKINIDDIPF
ncbi:hypothetical protein QF038_001815 [Pseudarthrobacter sp. W1I19]|uniref:hypothetical protein n=1 Tax=Pseudarthrobacter sp. W1I19 TaxID=3042288 RepID=UPI002788F809|nr:hypothetical protein [Pseudarthrobacter sp. W1I19]MDQ0923307.1 hypothetical protein [Pseudarthrobacter sp. W1I19]